MKPSKIGNLLYSSSKGIQFFKEKSTVNKIRLFGLYLKLAFLKSLWPWIKIKIVLKKDGGVLLVLGLISLAIGGPLVYFFSPWSLGFLNISKNTPINSWKFFHQFFGGVFSHTLGIIGISILLLTPLVMIEAYKGLKRKKLDKIENQQQKIEELTQVLIEKRRLDHHLPQAKNLGVKKRL